ncbi:hypothetical protein ACHWQZ_G005533 [Mnemiopsis leidyi]
MNCSRLVLQRIPGASPKHSIHSSRNALKQTRTFSPFIRPAHSVSTRNFSTQTRQDILVLNSGSSSLKFNLFSVDLESDSVTSVLSGAANGLTVTGDVDPEIKIKQGDKTLICDVISSPTHCAALSVIADTIRSHSSDNISAVGHRVVHGGTVFPESCVVDDSALDELARLNSLAPLHNPHNLAGIVAATEIFPGALQVGVFDTGYHATIPEHAFTYALPRHLATKYRKYGFHGTSHKYVVGEAAKFLGKDKINAISLHLGNGCSVACIKDNRSIDTTMGYTPLAGLPMGSRSGDIDPSIVIKLLQDEGCSSDEVSDILHNQSGLYGISGSSDSLTVERGYTSGDPGCKLAFNVFAYNVKKCIGAYTAILDNKVDCIIFTGGIGENSPLLHSLVCEGLHPLSHDNYSRSSHVSDIGVAGSSTQVLVVKTNEELAIAKECMKFMR